MVSEGFKDGKMDPGKEAQTDTNQKMNIKEYK